MFTSVILHQCEIWYNVTKREILSLEAVDYYMLRQAWETSSKTSSCLIMLDMGLLPLRYMIKMKRLGYLHCLISKDDSSLVKQVFRKQVIDPIRGDFINDIYNDLKELQTNLSFEQIFSLSKSSFKKLVSNACRAAAFHFIISEKKQIEQRQGNDVF